MIICNFLCPNYCVFFLQIRFWLRTINVSDLHLNKSEIMAIIKFQGLESERQIWGKFNKLNSICWEHLKTGNAYSVEH